MKITITKKHCEGADYASNTDCPLARALKEAGFSTVIVEGRTIFVESDRFTYTSYDFKVDMWNFAISEQLAQGIRSTMKENRRRIC